MPEKKPPEGKVAGSAPEVAGGPEAEPTTGKVSPAPSEEKEKVTTRVTLTGSDVPRVENGAASHADV